jgi:predicted RecA/RadA family phage recombinase
MDAKYSQDGKIIAYTNGATALEAGDIIAINGKAGVAISDIAASTVGSIGINGVYAIRKKNEAMQAGFPVRWDANGNPKVGTAGTGAATQILGDAVAAGDIFVGTAIAAAAAADEYVYVDINAVSPTCPAEWLNVNRLTKAADANAGVTETGVVYDVTTDTKIITLPATAVGLRFTVMNAANDGAALVEVDFQAGDKNLGGCGVAAGGDGKKLSNTKATAKKGDFITFVSDGTDGYRIENIRGTWAQEG